MLISFEGIDGCGKTTIAKAVYERLSNLSMKVLLTKEPGDTESGKYIRDILLQKNNALDPLSEFLLFATDRRLHVKEVIIPHLRENYVILSDRFMDSSVAYQGYGRGVPISFIESVHKEILNGVRPDMTFLFDLPVSISLSRLKDKDRIERYGEKFFARVRKGYLTLARKEENRFIILDGKKSVETLADEVFTTIINHIEEC